MARRLLSEADADADADTAAAADDEAVRVVSLDDDDAEALISALSSETARAVYAALRREPTTASGLSESVATSIQNVRHHLTNLEDAGLVRAAGTRYSCKGREMTVYAPAHDAVVVCVGSAADRERLRDALVDADAAA